MKTRRAALAALAITAIGVAACSSDKKQEAEATTTSSSVAASTTSTVAETTTSANTATTAPPTTAPSTAAPTTATPTTARPTTPTHALYDQVDGPQVPAGHTSAFASSGVLADGVYWVTYNGGEQNTPDISVYQAFFGAECISKAAEIGDECNNDYLVLDTPTRDINDLPFATGVHLTVASVDTQESYWITPAELVTVRAGSPSAGAPAGFSFTPFPFIMTVKSGQIVGFEQLWVP